MKNENISKINKLGKAGKIISIFFLIASITVFVSMTLLSVVCFTLNDDFISGKLHGAGTINTNITSSLLGDYDESEIKFEKSIHFVGFTFKLQEDEDKNINIDTEKNDDGSTDVTLDVELPSGENLKLFGGIISAGIAVLALCATIALMFVKKLFSALEKCSSPFEENVLLRMKRFSFSLIPLGAFDLMIFGLLNLELIAAIVLIFLFTAIFSYGAQLQKESDETL